MRNDTLQKAKNEKNTEFYTQLVDIENELKHYKEHFKGKTIFCNCDDPYESNFFQYFANNFKFLGLKKLITMGYKTSPIANTQLSLFEIEGIEKSENKEQAYKIEVIDVIDVNKDGAINKIDVDILIRQNKDKIKVMKLKQSGDFRSEESVKCLKEADIVVTNPPFSLFREYVAQLIQYNKKFIIWGNNNAITYKEIFPLLKNNQIWLGYMVNKTCIFALPDSYQIWDEKITKLMNNGRKYGKVPAISIFTNLEIKKRHENLILYKNYNAEEYPKYDNYNAINVGKVSEIPFDYDGIMGVPITFLGKYNPEQFKIICSDYEVKEGLFPELKNKNWNSKFDRGYISGKRIYPRILIKKL